MCSKRIANSTGGWRDAVPKAGLTTSYPASVPVLTAFPQFHRAVNFGRYGSPVIHCSSFGTRSWISISPSAHLSSAMHARHAVPPRATLRSILVRLPTALLLVAVAGRARLRRELVWQRRTVVRRRPEGAAAQRRRKRGDSRADTATSSIRTHLEGDAALDALW